jgi:hypothetical protein
MIALCFGLDFELLMQKVHSGPKIINHPGKDTCKFKTIFPESMIPFNLNIIMINHQRKKKQAQGEHPKYKIGFYEGSETNQHNESHAYRVGQKKEFFGYVANINEHFFMHLIYIVETHHEGQQARKKHEQNFSMVSSSIIQKYRHEQTNGGGGTPKENSRIRNHSGIHMSFQNSIGITGKFAQIFQSQKATELPGSEENQRRKNKSKNVSFVIIPDAGKSKLKRVHKNKYSSDTQRHSQGYSIT